MLGWAGGRMQLACALALAAFASSGCTGDLFHDTTWAESACPADGEPLDGACVVTNDRGVFVRNEGDDADAGTREAPVKTLAKAIALAKSSNKRVYACNQTFAEAIVVPSGVSIYGALDCEDDWRFGNTKTQIAPDEEGIPVILDAGLATTVLADVSISAADASAPGASSIGMLVRHTPAVIRRARIAAGNGARGADGVTEMMAPTAGNVGVQGGSCTSGVGAPPPDAPECGGNEPYSGGKGGDGGNPNADGAQGTPLETGGSGGTAMDAASSCDRLHVGEHGDKGANGSSGDGASDSDPGGLSSEGFVAPPAGKSGGRGKIGGGGGGGGGGFNVSGGCLGKAPGGGSGGTGGCGGAGGPGGASGGASIALVSYDADIVLSNAVLQAADGGAGGDGAQGQAGGKGGPGGDPGANQTEKPGCMGGDGGDGGNGGPGGGGRGGHALAIAFVGKAPLASNDTQLKPGKGGPGGAAGDGLPSNEGANGKGIDTDATQLELPDAM